MAQDRAARDVLERAPAVAATFDPNAGRGADARRYYESAIEIASAADSMRPDLEHARAYVAAAR